jgi:hypothetical protein
MSISLEYAGESCRHDEGSETHGQGMGAGTPTNSAYVEASVQKLADDLQTETSPEIILEHLEALSTALEDQAMGAKLALVFLRAGGLPTVIHHLDPPAMSALISEEEVTPSSIRVAASKALRGLLRTDTVNDIRQKLHVAEGLLPPLGAAFRDASLPIRDTVVRTLALLAIAQPAQCKGMVDADVMGLFLAFYCDVGDSREPMEFTIPVAKLTIILVKSDLRAAHQLKQAILGPKIAQTFAALVLLQV